MSSYYEEVCKNIDNVKKERAEMLQLQEGIREAKKIIELKINHTQYATELEKIFMEKWKNT